MRHRLLPTALTALIAALALAACQAEGEYSTWPCRFGYDNAIHQDPALATATNVASRGVFCRIYEDGVYYVFQNNQNLTSRQPKSEQEKLASQTLGLNNGIIVGFQTFVETPNGGFVGYDEQCPNCVRRENNTLSPNYRVQVASNGIATCRKCGKKYDLNNGGIIQNGTEGDVGLQKYLATTTGPYGYVYVGTKR